MDLCLTTEPVSELKDKVIDEVISESGDSSKVVENKGLQKMEQDVSKQEVVLQLPEEVKCLMKEGNDLYKMGHHSEALVKYALCIERLWPGKNSPLENIFPVLNWRVIRLQGAGPTCVQLVTSSTGLSDLLQGCPNNSDTNLL